MSVFSLPEPYQKISLYPVLPVPWSESAISWSESAILETKLFAFNFVLSLPEPYQKPPCTLYSLYLHPSQQYPDPSQQSWPGKQNCIFTAQALSKNLPVPCTPCTFIRISNPGNKTLCIQLCALTAWAFSETSLYPVLPVPGSDSESAAFNSVSRFSLPKPSSYHKPPCALYSLYLDIKQLES
jgi:hypothetical protein